MTITLKLDPAPTFKAKVNIPVAGSDKGADIVCEFGHMTLDEYRKFTAGAADRDDMQATLAILRGWEGPDLAFSPETVAKLLQNYPGAAYAISERFSIELMKARSGN